MMTIVKDGDSDQNQGILSGQVKEVAKFGVLKGVFLLTYTVHYPSQIDYKGLNFSDSY